MDSARPAQRLRISGKLYMRPMANDFDAELARVVDAIGAENREHTRAEIAALVRAGVTSRGDLASVLLNDQAGELRAVACWLLGRLAADEGLPALMATLKGREPRLRRYAAIALGECRKDDAVPVLIEAMRTDPDEFTRTAAAWALGEIKDPSAIDALLTALADREVPAEVRGQAAEALACARDARVVPALIAALADSEPEVRFFSAFALGQSADAAALPALEHVAASDDASVAGWGSVKQEAQAALERIRRSPTRKRPDP